MKTAVSKATLCVVLSLVTLSLYAKEYNDNGSAATYALADGDILNINSGTFTGTISSFASGSSINIKSGATFNPASMAANAAGTINNYGKVSLNVTTSQAMSSLKLNNYGSFSAHDVQVGSGTVLNGVHGKIYLNSLGMSGSLDNAGAIYVAGAVNLSCGNCSTTNQKGASLYGGSITIATTFTNDGYTYSKSTFSKTGGSALTNNCTLVSAGDITFAQGNVTNNGYVIALSGLFTNTASFTNSTVGHVQGVDFTNGNTANAGDAVQLKGGGNFLFTGHTANIARGFGLDGTSSVYINFYDQTNTSGNILDNETRKPSSTVTKNRVYPVDTATAKTDCNASVTRSILPVKLLSFYVEKTESNQVAVRWTVAEQVAVHHYEVEWSKNGSSFVSKAFVFPIQGTEVINYATKVSPDVATTYYLRIKVVNENGSVEYSPIKLVHTNLASAEKFTIGQNPARSQTTIMLSGFQKETNLSLTLHTLTGQVVLRKQINNPVTNNTLSIAGLEQFPAGVYYVRVSGGMSTQTQKLVIQ